MAQAASEPCEICDGGTGHHYCQQCDQVFCDNCKTAHLRIKTTKWHTFQSVRNINPEENPFCSDHDEPFIFHCVDCDAVVCQICVVKKHNRHEMTSIKDSVLKLKEQLETSVESKYKAIGSDSEQLKLGDKIYHSEAKAVINSITEDATCMKDWIDARAETLIKMVKVIEAKNHNILSKAYSRKKSIINKIIIVQKTIADTTSMSDVALLPKLKKLQTEIDQMETKKVPAMPSIKYRKNEITKNDIKKLLGKCLKRDIETDQDETKQESRQESSQDDDDEYYDGSFSNYLQLSDDGDLYGFGYGQETEDEQYGYGSYGGYGYDGYGYGGYGQETEEEHGYGGYGNDEYGI